MVIEAKKNFFNILTISRELQPGDCYVLEEGTITAVDRVLEVSVVNENEVVVQEEKPRQGSRTPDRRVVGSMQGEDINSENLASSRILGIKNSIHWKSSQ